MARIANRSELDEAVGSERVTLASRVENRLATRSTPHGPPRGSGDWNGILAADTLASPVSALERDASRLSRQPCWHPTEFTRE